MPSFYGRHFSLCPLFLFFFVFQLLHPLPSNLSPRQNDITSYNLIHNTEKCKRDIFNKTRSIEAFSRIFSSLSHWVLSQCLCECLFFCCVYIPAHAGLLSEDFRGVFIAGGFFVRIFYFIFVLLCMLKGVLYG